MADTEKPVEHHFAVSGDDFIRFLEGKTGSTACPACESIDWTIIINPIADKPYRIVTPLRQAERAMQLLTYGIFCNECGYVRQHLCRIVKEWVDANPPEQVEMEFDEGGDDRA